MSLFSKLLTNPVCGTSYLNTQNLLSGSHIAQAVLSGGRPKPSRYGSAADFTISLI